MSPLLLTAALWGVVDPASTASVAEASDTEGVATVLVTVAGAEAERAFVRETLQELLDRLDVELVVSERPELDLQVVFAPVDQTPDQIRVFVDLGDPDRPLVFVGRAGGDRMLVQAVEAGELDEVAREELGYIVQAAVEALLAGAEIGIGRAEAASQLGVESPPVEEPSSKEEPPPDEEPPPAEEPPPPPIGPPPVARSVPSIWWGALAGYRLRGFGSGLAPAHGPTLAGRVRSSGPLGWGGQLELGLSVHPPVLLGGALEVRTQALAPRGAVGLAPRLGPNVRLPILLGAGVDVVFVDPRAVDAFAEPAARSTVVLGMASMDVGPAWQLGKGVVISAGLGLDADLTGLRFSTRDGPSFRALRLRPGGFVQLGWGRPRG